ncbi:Lrp/AsnC family transcriptional regulator [Nocardioides glacieisoli]|uniref:Lrp/AsnC family transcriptional regulator n=1 Tax=Nocardioides glacieisoli TaxID=1168730 RepID=A0A4Q2RXD4_9ACTN|nr:Lrp/AsnC family transcriptional regulator [Nocardioides glacieisoli]RYB92263.1 Lrp/AsnC family transcriptional regulator [Nocardioides glacieisoli]
MVDPRPTWGLAGASLDALDIDIIRVLQGDGRASSVDIARTLDEPVATVRRKVGELVSSGVVRIRAVTHPSVLGLRSMCLVSIRVKSGVSVSRFAESLLQVPEIDYVATCMGRFQVLVEVLAPSPGVMAEVVETKLHMAPEVESLEVSPYFHLHYLQPDFTRPVEGVPAVGERAEPLDGVDTRIVIALNRDGRQPFKSIGTDLGMSESQVRKRVGRLVNAGHLRIMGVVDPNTLGFRTNVWIFATPTAGTPLSELAAAFAQIASVTFVASAAGRWAVLVEAVCRDEADVLRMIEEQVLTMGSLGSFETAIVSNLYFNPPTAAR